MTGSCATQTSLFPGVSHVAWPVGVTPSRVQAPSYWQLIRDNVAFRSLWLGVVVSFFGDWFSTIALYTLTQDLTDSARALASILIAKTLPIFLVSPIVGPLVDRLDRRLLLIGSDLVRAGLTVLLIAAAGSGSLELAVGVLVLRTAFTGLFISARNASIPALTTSAELPVAMALSGGTWSVMLALGAGLGGFVTAWAGVSGALGIDALTYLLSAAFLWGLPPLLPAGAGASGARTSFLDGLAVLRGRWFLSGLLLSKSGLALSTASLVTLPMYGNGQYAATAGPVWIGALYMARGLGALIGTVGVRKLTGDQTWRLAHAMPVGFVWMAASLASLSLAPSIGWAALAFLAAGIGNGTTWVFSGILAQRTIPDGYRGRLFSLEFGLMTLFSASSSWLGGVAIDAGGCSVQQVNLAVGALLLGPASLWVLLLWGVPPDREA